MSIHDIKGDNTIDFIADLIEPIMNLVEDDKVSELFKREKVPEGVDPKQFFMSRVKKLVPSLIKNHKEDFIKIFAALDGKTVEDYRNELSPMKLIKDSYNLFSDEELLSFLALPSETKTQFGSASENSEVEA